MTALHTLQDLVDLLAEHGGREALIAFRKESTQSFTCGQAAATAQRLARGMAAQGLEAGARVLMFAPGQAEWILACLAVISAGAVPVPLDAQIARDEFQHVLAQCEARWAVTTTTLSERFEGERADMNLVLLDASPQESRSWHQYLADSGPALHRAAAEDPAVLFYTSGTSGQPKGVPLTHANLISNVDALLQQRLLRDNDRVLVPLPLHHVYPFTMGILLPLAAGAPIILPHALTGAELVRAVKQGGATAIVGVPRLYNAFYDGIESSMRQRGRLAGSIFRTLLALSVTARRNFGIAVGRWLFAPVRSRIGPRLRLLASGGSALEPELAWKLQGLGWQIASGYGLTETSPLLTFNLPGREKIGSAGRAIPGVDIRIGKPAEDRQVGEVEVRGPNVFSGYWRMPEKTAEVFTPDGYFRTGDLGRIDDQGYLYLEGRASSMIVLSGGENVHPENVEAALEKSPHIREAAVLQKGDRLAALLVPEPAAERDGRSVDDSIRAEIKSRTGGLPSHHRISQYAITHEPLPRTRIGKLRRHLLQERFEQAMSGKEKATGAVAIEELNPEDQQLLRQPAARAVWSWLPGRFPEARIAPESHLQLDLGIDSLDWLNLTVEIHARAGAELDEAAIGRIETVRDLLREVAQAGAETAPGAGRDPLEKLARPEELLSPEQRRWLEPRTPPVRVLGSALLAVNRLLMRSVFRLSVRGTNLLPVQGPFVLMPNHASYLDPLAVGAALPHAELKRTYWGGWTGIMFANPLMRLVSRAVRVMPIDPRGGPLSSIAFGVAALKGGCNLIWFPEGGRSVDGALAGFRPGIGVLARAQPVPFVPVFIEGTYEALPVAGRLPRPHRVTVTFGEPVNAREIDPEAWAHNSYQAIADALHARLVELMEHCRRGPGGSARRRLSWQPTEPPRAD